MKQFPIALVFLVGLVPTLLSAANFVEGTITRAESNDNRERAGRLERGTLKVHLIAQQARWYPEAEDGPFRIVEAFSESGKPPRVPAPLIRVPVGTALEATITNSLNDTIGVIGLSGYSDTIWIAPGQSRQMRHVFRAAGTFLYAAGQKREGTIRFGGTNGQLVGGLVVDPVRPRPDRIFITTGWDPVPIAGNGYFLAMNGKSWPYTEKLVHTVGDTVRWRVLNGGGGGDAAHHPMHLHGFYFRVDARGGWGTDTTYSEGQRRWVVTESLPGRSTMSLTWVPSRAGNWLFHCHNADHVAGRNRHVIAGRERPFPQAPTHDAQSHMQWDMSGLVTAITVLPEAAQTAETKTTLQARELRLLIQERAKFYGTGPGYGFVLQKGASEPAADSIVIPGTPLILRRDEPVRITVVNRSSVHTSVHWHGIELKSFYDGVAGWSGFGEQLAPMIMPKDSFVVRFTPPRAGTFIYHAHATDHVQLARGLYGPLIVMEPDEEFDSNADHIVVVGFGRPGGKASMLLNGSSTPVAVERRREGKQRLRLINITPEVAPLIELSADSLPLSWRPIAKDGFDLPRLQQVPQPARVRIFPGETYDFEFASDEPVLYLRATLAGQKVTMSIRSR
jgi:FtsP/CotA-like multicopper oxidase with cupredoxin domain